MFHEILTYMWTYGDMSELREIPCIYMYIKKEKMVTHFCNHFDHFIMVSTYNIIRLLIIIIDENITSTS